jgi:hypothetical protein
MYGRALLVIVINIYATLTFGRPAYLSNLNAAFGPTNLVSPALTIA